VTESDAMLCTIYKGSRENELYLYVPQKAGKDNIPDTLRERMGDIIEVMTLQLTPDKRLARANAVKVLNDIKEKGYYLQLPPDITGQVTFDGD
jgi:uncharacterized protein